MQSPDGELLKMFGDKGIVLALIWEALRGDVNAIREIMDRIDGKVPQKLQGEGFNDKEIIIIHNPKVTKEVTSAPVSDRIPV